MESMSRDRDDATFDLTPMIDVVLLLIIFFMMTTQFARSEHAAVNLPIEKGEEAAAEGDRTIFLDLAPDGSVTLRGSTYTVSDAVSQIRAALGDLTDSRIVIRADRDCPTSRLSILCAALSQAGFRSVSLGTQGSGS